MKHWVRSPVAWTACGMVATALLATLSVSGRGETVTARLATPTVAATTSTPIPDRPDLWQGKLDYAAFDRRFEQLMAKPGMVGLAVAMVENGRLSFVRGYGLADREAKLPVTTDTVFRWASLSKGVAGTLAYRLAEEGKLNLATPISRFQTTLRLPKQGEERITVPDLLAHRVGIAHNAYDGRLEDGQDPRLIRASLGSLGLRCEPGDCHSYQNVAYDAVSEVIARATGSTYAAEAEERLFKPLGMASAGLGRNNLTGAERWAKPYRGGQLRTLSDAYFRVPAAAGVSSNIVDLARWMQAQMGEAPEVLSPAVLREIHRPRVDTDRQGSGELRRVSSAHGYGQGWRSFDYDGHWLVGHGGAVDGYRAAILFDPALRTGIVMLWNSTDTRPFKLQYEWADQLYDRPFYDWTQLGSWPSGSAPVMAD